jgi:hypothetical protein
MFDDYGKMLVTTKMNGLGSSHEGKGSSAWGLRPTIAVQIGQQSVAWVTVKMDCTAESCLGQHRFHHASSPVS